MLGYILVLSVEILIVIIYHLINISVILLPIAPTVMAIVYLMLSLSCCWVLR